MLHTVSLGLVLAALWLLLSGYFIPLILVLGLLSVIVSVFLVSRMDVVDHEAVPMHLSWRIVFYWVWLLKEILVSALHISAVILRRRMPIHPAMLDIRASQKGDLGRVIYANSITLTPGTVTVALDGDTMAIHALTRDTAEGLLGGEMDRRVTAIEGISPLDRLRNDGDSSTGENA